MVTRGFPRFIFWNPARNNIDYVCEQGRHSFPPLQGPQQVSIPNSQPPSFGTRPSQQVPPQTALKGTSTKNQRAVLPTAISPCQTNPATLPAEKPFQGGGGGGKARLGLRNCHRRASNWVTLLRLQPNVGHSRPTQLHPCPCLWLGRSLLPRYPGLPAGLAVPLLATFARSRLGDLDPW